MSNNAKILFVHHGRMLGGAPVSLLNTIQGLEKLGYDNMKILFARNEMKPFFQKNCNALLGDIYNPCLYLGRFFIGWSAFEPKRFFYEVLILPRSVYKQYKTFCNEKPAIVHLNSAILFSSAIAARLAGCKVVWHVREILSERKIKLVKNISGWMLRKIASKVIAISHAEAKSLGGKNDRKVEVVYNSVDFEKFDYKLFDQNEQKRKLGFAPKAKIVLCISNFNPRKGTLEIIQSLSYLQENVEIVVVGIGTEEMSDSKTPDNYKRQVIEELKKGHQEKIRFAGLQADVRGFIAASDLLVAPWVSAHFARPIFEAWAMKKPVVAFDISGISEVVEDGVDGLLVKDRTAEGLAKAVGSVIFDERKLREMAEAGYRKAYNNFRQEINARRISEIYKALVTKTA